MNALIKIVEQEVQITLQQIQGLLDSKGITNTGKSKDDLTYEVAENKVIGFANEYFQYLVFGRAPGKHPPVDDLREWVRTKLGISDEQENKTVAFLVGRKIAEEGTTIYNNKSKGIDLDEILSNLADRIAMRVPEEAVIDIENMINEPLKQKFK